ncbi:MAG: hypothetical protein AAF429_09935 [Pseudomonadota bacterium]
MKWILILLLSGHGPTAIEFDTEFACREAGKTVVKTQPEETAQYFCFPKNR